MSQSRILVVDDSPLVRKLAEVSLQEAGYEVYTAENGEDGLKIAQTVIPDLILVDFIMPKMTGSQFCMILKENEKLKDIPILLITGKGETVGQTFVEKYGVIDYFIKPFKSEDLVEKVEEILGKITLIESEKLYIETDSIEEFIEEEKIAEMISNEEIIFSDEEMSKVELPLALKSEVIDELELIKSTDETDIAPHTPQNEIKEEESVPASSIFEEDFHSELGVEISKELTDQLFEEKETLSQEIRDFNGVKETPETHMLIEDDSFAPLDEHQENITIIDEISSTEEKIEIEEIEEFHKIEEDLREEIAEPEKSFLSAVNLQEIELLIDKKISKLSQEILSTFNYSLENTLKKYGLAKQMNVVLSGTMNGVRISSLLKFIMDSKINGVLTLFASNSVFEILLLDGKIVYCISDNTRINLGNRLLKDLNSDELKQIIKENFSILINSQLDYFVFEKKEFTIDSINSFSRYEIEELL